MKITTNKYGEVSIRWEYNLTNGDRDVTKAYLEKRVEKDKEVIKEVSVMRRPNEPYDKNKAKEFALGKLVRESFLRADELGDRKEVWSVYNQAKYEKRQRRLEKSKRRKQEKMNQ